MPEFTVSIDTKEEKKMDIDNLREKRRCLESDIAERISLLVEKFKDDTGFCPHYIAINMMDTTVVGDKERQYVVEGCTIDINI